jgi:hypothetical protein
MSRRAATTSTNGSSPTPVSGPTLPLAADTMYQWLALPEVAAIRWKAA